MKREQYISLKLRGRADNQSDFIEQKRFAFFCGWEAQITQHLIVADQLFFTKSALRPVQTYILV
jgi:hypothetical protein